MNVIPIRLNPGDDLKLSLLTYCSNQDIDAAFVLSGVGSLSRGMMRLAQQSDGIEIQKPLEMLFLSGTVSRHCAHLHMAISDGDGQVLGGHLLEGSIIRTTAEIVLGVVPDVVFNREIDPATGYRELSIVHQGMD